MKTAFQYSCCKFCPIFSKIGSDNIRTKLHKNDWIDFQYTLPFSNKSVMNYISKPPNKKCAYISPMFWRTETKLCGYHWHNVLRVFNQFHGKKLNHNFRIPWPNIMILVHSYFSILSYDRPFVKFQMMAHLPYWILLKTVVCSIFLRRLDKKIGSDDL